jgi:hypothetical protein
MSCKTLILAAVVQLLISCSPLKSYKDLPEVTKWEPDIAAFDSLNRAENYPDDAILFAGSSSIRLWETLAGDMAPYSVIQRGYGGAKLSDYGVYADRIFSPHKCSALVLFIANDITGGTNDRSPEEVRKLFSVIHKEFRKSNPGAPVFYIGVTPTMSRWKAWPEIKRGNELVREWCESKRNTYFIGTDTAFLDATGEPREELFISDKLHLNAEGYKIWTEIIKGELDRVLQ